MAAASSGSDHHRATIDHVILHLPFFRRAIRLPMNFRASSVLRCCEKFRSSGAFNQYGHGAAAPTSPASRSAWPMIVRGHDDLDAAARSRRERCPRLPGRVRVKARSRLIEEQHGRVARQRARQRKLAAARHPKDAGCRPPSFAKPDQRK